MLHSGDAPQCPGEVCQDTFSKVPTRWFVADDLPLTPTGKVSKFKVVDLIADGAFRELAITPRSTHHRDR